MYCLLRSRFLTWLVVFSFMLYRAVVLCNSEVPMGKKYPFSTTTPRAVHCELQACDVHHNLHEYLYQSPKIHSNNVRVSIYHAAFPSGPGRLSLALVPWSIEKPNRTDWLTRVLPTSRSQSDMNILASLGTVLERMLLRHHHLFLALRHSWYAM
jgi:hypothetical protein